MILKHSNAIFRKFRTFEKIMFFFLKKWWFLLKIVGFVRFLKKKKSANLCSEITPWYSFYLRPGHLGASKEYKFSPKISLSTGGGGYKTGNMCGYKTGIMCGYKTNHSKKNCAGMTAIRPITRKFFARKFFTRKFLDLCKRSFLRKWLL